FRQASATDCYRPALHEHFNAQRLGERQGIECVQASLNFLPELSLRQMVNTSEKLLRIWRSRRLWQAGQEFAAMPQGQSCLLVTGICLAKTLQDLGCQVELTPVFVYLAEESHRFSLDGLLRGVTHQAFEGSTCWGRLPQPMLGTRQYQSALRQQTAEWVALCQGRDGFRQGR